MSASPPLAPSPRSAPVSSLAVAAALAVLYVVWGSTYLGIRFALEGGWPPLLMAGIRFLVAGSVLFTVLRLRGVPMPPRRQWRPEERRVGHEGVSQCRSRWSSSHSTKQHKVTTTTQHVQI